MPRSIRLAVLAFAAASGCATRSYNWPRPTDAAKPPPKAGASATAPASRPIGFPQSPESSSAAGCANAKYGLECGIPDGYLLTQEGRGPGMIFTFVKRARGSEEEANLVMRVTGLGKLTLENFVERRVARDLKKAQGVGHWEKNAALVGERSGIEVLVERQYASGAYKSRIFCFQEGTNVFILDHTVPAARYEREKKAFDEFVSSIAFAE